MRNKSFQFSFLVLVLVLFLGFTFVAPKTVRADALGDFIERLTLGDFIRNLFVGIFGGSAGDPSYPNPDCQYENLNACISDDCSRRGGNCTQQGCNSGRYRCTISAPSATPTARPTNTPVPLPPTSTPRPGGATSTPGPTNTPVPLPPVNSPAPTNPVNTPCYYNVKLIDASGGALPSALQTGNTESGGCRTPGVRELVPSYYTQGSSSTNRPEWPCTDATYVGQNCTQGIVTGQFVCMGGPLHEIKGCYNRSSGAYQRVSVTSLGPTNTPMPEPTNTPAPAYGSFDEWAAAFRRYLYGSGQYSVSLSDLEDWRNDVPPVITPTPTELP